MIWSGPENLRHQLPGSEAAVLVKVRSRAAQVHPARRAQRGLSVCLQSVFASRDGRLRIVPERDSEIHEMVLRPWSADHYLDQ